MHISFDFPGSPVALKETTYKLKAKEWPTNIYDIGAVEKATALA